jgi:hypothetical protein
LEASIVGIGHGRTVYLLGNVFIKGVMDIEAVPDYDLWDLTWWDHTITSTCYIPLRCFQNLWKVMLHDAIMRSMATNIPKCTI